MKCYFVSDNSFFIDGLRQVLKGSSIHERSIFVNINEDEFYDIPEQDDIVVLAVSNVCARRKILHIPEIALCRLVIMGRTGARMMPRGIFIPWLVSGSLTKEQLINTLNILQKSSFKMHQLSVREADIFFYLGAGLSHDEVADIMGLPSKYVYALKRKVNISLGLLDCNSATSILLCRDIAEMRTYNKKQPVLNRFTFENSVAFY